MVQPSFSHPRQNGESSSGLPSVTAPLDQSLDGQNQTYYEELYRSEAVCLCVLRLLPPVCRQIILNNIWSHSPLRVVDVKVLCQIDVTSSLAGTEEIVRPALERKILHPMQNRKGKMEWPVNDMFKRGLRNALTGLGTSNSFGVAYDRRPGDKAMDEDELIEIGEEKWESILKYMVSSSAESGYIAATRPSTEVLELLLASGLMSGHVDTSGRGNDRLTITSKGFQFLLEDRQTQLWQILMYFLTLKEANSERSAEVLSVFFSLGCMQLGQDYSATRSFPRAHKALDDLSQYGFLAKPSGPGSDQFFPTHLATSLCSGESAASDQDADEKKFIILETNYKIYAYTQNELEIAILALFVDIKIRYKNLVVGKLDRANVKRAMEMGISANQIISYLQSHAHPQMYLSPPPLLHPTIVDQLHLWDKERNRLQTDDSVMFEFFSKDLFDDTAAEAARYDGLLHSVPDLKILFIQPGIKDAIRDFVQSQQRQLRADQ